MPVELLIQIHLRVQGLPGQLAGSKELELTENERIGVPYICGCVDGRDRSLAHLTRRGNMETQAAHGLKVISTSTSVKDHQEGSPTTAAQQSLFPLRSSRTAIFMSLPEVDHYEFVSLLKSTAPAIVVELRKIPRFDFGPLNRGSIFDLFREQGDIYLDLGQSQESDQHLFASRIEEKLQVHIKQHRPIVFLTSPA
jgi:hypothetical protein